MRRRYSALSFVAHNIARLSLPSFFPRSPQSRAQSRPAPRSALGRLDELWERVIHRTIKVRPEV